MEYWNITGPLHNIHFNGGIRNHFETIDIARKTMYLALPPGWRWRSSVRERRPGAGRPAGGRGAWRGPGTTGTGQAGSRPLYFTPSLCKHRPHLGGLHLELEMFIPLGSIFIPPSAILSSRSRRYQLFVGCNCRHAFGRERNYATINNHNNQFSFIIQRKYCTLQSPHHRDLPWLSKAV